jgi:D-lactate dehydrogenase
MRVAVFSTKPYDRRFLEAAGTAHAFAWIEARLDPATARLAEGSEAACLFVNDRADAAALEVLAAGGVRLLALRSAGFNHVDLGAAARLGIAVGRVPAYSPEAVAEHAVALILTLNRHTHRAFNRVREGNFALEGLLGFDLHGKTAGVIGTGQIGLPSRASWRASAAGCSAMTRSRTRSASRSGWSTARSRRCCRRPTSSACTAR